MPRRSLLSAFEEEFHKTKGLADRAVTQVDDAALHVQINPRQNSIAAIVQHMAGNALSRWTDFMTTDGEKPNRNPPPRRKLQPNLQPPPQPKRWVCRRRRWTTSPSHGRSGASRRP